MSGRRGASRGCAGAVQLQRRGPPYLRRLDPGQSDAAVAERRSEPTGPDPRERPSCEEVRWLNGTRRVGDVVSARPPTRGRQSPALRSGRGVSLRRLPDPARPSAVAAWSAKLRGLSFPPSCVPAATASPFALLAALCPFPPFPALRVSLLSACLPRLLRRSFTPASSRSPWLAGTGRVKAETAPRLGGSGF